MTNDLLPHKREHLLPLLYVYTENEYLEMFLRNLLLNENHPLHSRALHISGLYQTSEKANIEAQKANIESSFTAKTAAHVITLLERFGFDTVFGRTDIQEVLGLKQTRRTELLGEIVDKGFASPVKGFGKGRYRFVQHRTLHTD